VSEDIEGRRSNDTSKLSSNQLESGLCWVTPVACDSRHAKRRATECVKYIDHLVLCICGLGMAAKLEWKKVSDNPARLRVIHSQ
jgi:hypothetical protein